MDSQQLQFIVVVDISVIAHGQIPMVIEILQLQCIDKVVDVGCAGVVACPLCASTDAVVDVAVMPQRPVPAVGLNSWNDG